MGLKIGECQALKCQDFLTLWYGQGSHRNIFALAVFSILPKINYEVVTIINCRAKPVGPRFPRKRPSTFKVSNKLSDQPRYFNSTTYIGCIAYAILNKNRFKSLVCVGQKQHEKKFPLSIVIYHLFQ